MKWPQFELWRLFAAITIFGLLVGGCCLWPPLGRRVPDNLTQQVKVGMTREQVYNIVGEPNERQSLRDGELWGYYIQEFGLTAFLNPVYVRFGADGRVEVVWVQ